MNGDREKFPCLIGEKFKAMGTDIDLQIVVTNDSELLQVQSDLVIAEGLYKKIENIFSRFDENSELSKLNQNLGKFLPASLEMQMVIKLVLEFHKKTNGVFDPRIINQLESIGYSKDYNSILTTKIAENNSSDYGVDLNDELIVDGGKVKIFQRMDFSGIVKGWATDQVADFFKEQGWKNFLVDSGGDMFFCGHDEKEKPWYIDIEGVSYQKILFKLDNLAIATSGIGKRKWEKEGKRFHHLINPNNPANFSFEIQSVTVISTSVTQADVFAKTIFILGKEKGMAFAKESKLPCVILNYDGSAWISPQTKKYLYDKKV